MITSTTRKIHNSLSRAINFECLNNCSMEKRIKKKQEKNRTNEETNAT